MSALLSRSRAVVLALCLAGGCSGEGGGGSGVGNPAPPAPPLPSLPAPHTVGGTITGLSGSVVLTNNGGDDFTAIADGSFTFATFVPAGNSYQVGVRSQPPNQRCTVSSGSGTVGSADINNIVVKCVTTAFTVGGTISGLVGSPVVLRNNGGDDLKLFANGSFVFTTRVADSATYQVTVLAQPENQQCSIANASGSVASANVANVVVTCAGTYSIGGKVFDLVGTVVLSDGTDTVTLSGSGNGFFVFAFPGRLTSGTPYEVKVVAQPQPQPNGQCTVSSGSGTVGTADVTDVSVLCTNKPARYDPQSYSSFTSQHGTDNLEGTWMWLAEGTLSQRPVIVGNNYLEQYQLLSRTIVRIRRDPANPARYFIFTCGPGGGRDFSDTPSPFLPSTFPIPFYYFDTGSFFVYNVNVVDAVTMQLNFVNQDFIIVGSFGDVAMAWRQSWVFKRISDDPFSMNASLVDNLSGQTVNIGCIRESEGTFVATQNDDFVSNFRKEGPFFIAEAYISVAATLFNGEFSYTPQFGLRELVGYRTIFRHGDTFYQTLNGDSVSVSRTVTGIASSHSARASSADGLQAADDALSITP